MKKKELFKRYLLCIISLFFVALGVAFAKRAELGVSPVSSIPNIMNLRFPELSMGTWLLFWNLLLLLGQIILLRKKFQPIQLLQIPLSFIFSYFTDFGMWCVSFIDITSYITRLFMVLFGIMIMGFGIALAVIANVILNSGEAFVKAISDTFHKDFSNVKIALDITYVLLSILLSLLFFNFTIQGTREGTLIAAVGTGMMVKLFRPLLSKPLEKILTK